MASYFSSPNIAWILHHAQPSCSIVGWILCPSKIRQEFIICHIHTIVEHPFPVTAPCSVWCSKCITWWFHSKQLDCHIMIKIIFRIQVKAQICLITWLLATASNSFNKFALFENRGILGWSIMLITDWFMLRFPRDRKFLDSEKKFFVINWQPLVITLFWFFCLGFFVV